MNKNEIEGLLKTNTCEIVFTKTNGEKRVMKCTLLESALPPFNETSRKKTSNPDIIPVYDLENKDWRSFRTDSLVEIKVI